MHGKDLLLMTLMQNALLLLNFTRLMMKGFKHFGQKKAWINMMQLFLISLLTKKKLDNLLQNYYVEMILVGF